MKKIYSIVMLLLLSCVTTVQAQRRWTIANESATEILAGEDHTYVLKEGFNSGSWSKGYYLNSGSGDCIADVDISCIYHFIEVETKVVDGESYPVYVLKNVGNNKYLSSGNEKYVRSKNEAFKFTARKAVEYANGTDISLWNDYSQACEEARSHGAQEAGAWILCSVNERMYIGFGHNPSWWNYTDTNNWLVLEATEDVISEYEKMAIIFDQYCQNGVSPELFPVGTAPGQISQELYDQMYNAYVDISNALLLKPEEISDERCIAVREAVVAAFERYQKEMIPVGNGYFVIVNQRSLDAAYDAGSVAKCKLGVATPPEGWTLANTKYIWQIIESGDEGKFFIKNWGTGRYLGKGPGTSKPYPMVADSTVKFTAPQLSGVWFRLHDGENFAHNDGGGTVVVWNSTDNGNRWRFDPVPADTIDSLSSLVAQSMLNRNLANLIGKVKEDVLSIQTKNGFTDDGNYASAGLVKELAGTNCQEPSEGPAANLFDGRLDNFFHSKWSGALETDDWHWIQVDLGHAVSELYLKITERDGNTKNSPTKMLIVGAAGDDASGEWNETLATIDTLVYDRADSTTYVGKIPFSRAAQHIRLAVTCTKTNAVNGTRPFWSAAEMRFYDGAECVENPLYAMVPKEIKDALNATLAKAQGEVDAKAATQATYDELEAAIEKFWDAYPDPAGLEEDLEYAQAMHDAAEVGEGLGYFEEGAKEELLAVIENVKAQMEKTLSLAELEACEKQLKDALIVFNSKLHTPESGQIYRIISAAPMFNDEEQTKPKAQFQAAVCALNADINSTPMWRYGQDSEGTVEEKTSRFNTLWYVEKDEKGYTFRNLANGLYIDNMYEGLSEEEAEEVDKSALGYSATPKHFTIEAAKEPGSFVVVLYEGQYMNLQPTGKVVHWHGRDDAHAPFVFEAFDEGTYEEAINWQVDAEVGKSQILSLPIDVVAPFTNNLTALKVTGIYENAIQFDEYGQDEVIPAGTPFVVVTEDAETGSMDENFVIAQVNVDGADVNEILNLTYNYAPVAKDGLVSAPQSFELEPGFGFIMNEKVLVSEGGEDVAAGTGFFNKEIPAATEEGTHSLPIEGTINGEGVGIEKAEIVKNIPNDVYTVSGLKIRSNVKPGAAMKNLPKGVYIIGGKKVVVK